MGTWRFFRFRLSTRECFKDFQIAPETAQGVLFDH